MGTTYEKDPLAVQRSHGPARWLWTILALVLIGLVVFVLVHLYARPDESPPPPPASGQSSIRVDEHAYVWGTGPVGPCEPVAFEEEIGSDPDDDLFLPGTYVHLESV